MINNNTENIFHKYLIDDSMTLRGERSSSTSPVLFKISSTCSCHSSAFPPETFCSINCIYLVVNDLLNISLNSGVHLAHFVFFSHIELSEICKKMTHRYIVPIFHCVSVQVPFLYVSSPTPQFLFWVLHSTMWPVSEEAPFLVQFSFHETELRIEKIPRKK